MEEQILLDFVERSTRDEDLRQSLVHNPDQVIDELGLSPLVASVVRRLVPQLLEHGHVVVGTTGAFAIQVGQGTVDGKIGKDVQLARRGAAKVRRSAGQAAVHARVQPLVCLPGRQFPPQTKRGVRVIPWGGIVAEIAARNRTVSPNQARRFVEQLGGMPAPRVVPERAYG